MKEKLPLVFYCFFSFIVLSSVSVNAQTTLYSQGFETNLSGYSHTPSQTPSTDPGDQYFHRAEPSDSNIYEGSVGPYTNVTGSWLFVGSNPNTINSSNPGILSTGAIDVTGFTDFELSADFGAVPNDWDDADDLSVEYSWNNADWFVLYNFGHTNGTNDPLTLTNNATGGSNTANGTVLTYALQTIVSDNFSGSGNTLYLRIVCDAGSNYEAFGLDNIVLTGVAASSNPTVTFDSSSSSETETNATFATSGIPITLTNYDADVTITPTVNGSSTAEAGDYTIDLTPLVFDANETLSIPLSINPDAGFDNETIIIDIAVTSGTADLGTSTHTVTITDDEIPNIVINEILYDPATSVADGDSNGDGVRDAADDEFVEIVNTETSSVDISNYTIEDNSGTVHTFAASTTLPAGGSIVVFGGGTPTSIPGLSVTASSGSLSFGNGGETVTLRNAGGTTIDSHTYSGASDQSTARNIDLTGSFTGHNSITTNPVNFSPGRYNASNTSFETNTWKGSTDNDWDTASNWSTGSVPGGSDDVQVLSGITNYPTASGAVTINSATINSGASLIAQSTFSGTITYNRNLGTTNWYLVGAPVAGETIEDMISNNTFDTGSSSNIGWAPYDNSQAAAADRWDYQTAASTGSLTSGGGYSVKLASAGTLAFTGTMETANVGVSITDGTGSGGNAFNLVGNPFPSYMAANTNADGTNNLLTINTASLTEETLWLWDQGTGTYDQFNQASSAFYIAPGQGFFVESTGSNTFNFTEAMQSHQGSDSFQRTTNNRPEINLVMTDETDTRDTDILYIDGTTTGFDNGFDSSIFSGVGNSFAIYTHAVADGNGRNLGIQSLPNDNFENMVIPVGINATSGTQITISAGIFNLPAGIKVFLEDKSDNSFTELNSSSDFTTTLNADLNGIGRFYLHTKSQVLSVDEINADNISIYTSDANNLRIVGIQNGTAQVSIYNILGKEVVRTSFEGNGLNDVALPSLRTGVYIVQLATETGTLNKKVIIE
jgi:hypothetical protein